MILSINEEFNSIQRVDSGLPRIKYNAIPWVGSSLSRTELSDTTMKQDKPVSTHIPTSNRVDLGLPQIESSGIVPKRDKPVSTHIYTPNGVGLGLPQNESRGIVPKRDKPVSTHIYTPNGVGLGLPQIESSGIVTKRDKPVSTRGFCKEIEKTLIGQLTSPEQIEVLSDEI